MEWIAPTKDYNPRADLALFTALAAAVTEVVFVELERELAPDELPAPRKVVVLDSSEDGVTDRS